MADGGTSRGNVKNPAIRRIHADIRELQKDPSDQYIAAPLEENLFEWHFTLRGPPGTDFAGGVYHGRILLPSEYPFKPPNIMLLTPNGRFEVGKKICLSISAHHPEHWQPAWGVRLILEALISFFPTDPKGAVGSLDWTPQERRRLAAESQTWCCPRCGLAAGLLPPEAPTDASAPAAASTSTNSTDTVAAGGGGAGGRYAEEIAQLYMRGASASDADGSGSGNGGGQQQAQQQEQPPQPPSPAVAAASVPPHVSLPPEQEPMIRRRTTAAAAAAAAAPQPQAQGQAPAWQEEEDEEEGEDRLLYIALGLLLLIALLLGRKAIRASAAAAGNGGDGDFAHSFGGGDDDYFVG